MKEGWEKYNLMDICNVTTGKHDANHAEENGKYRFYTCSSQYVYCNTKRYEGECIILPGNGVNVGESYYFNGEFDAYQRTYVIDKIDKRIIPMFLYYHLQNNWKSEGVAKQYGSATNYIKIGNFKDYIVKSPQSLSEQQAIVDYLDSAFAKIDAMKANAEKALNEAKALFQASLKEMLEPKEGWEEKKMGDIADFVRGPFGGSLTKSMFKSSGYAVYEQQHAIHQHINIRYFIDDAKFNEMERFSVKAGDIIMSCSGVTLGKINILPPDSPAGIINQALLKMTVKASTNVRFFKYWLESNYFQAIIKKYSGGAAIPNVPAVKILKDFVISIPSLSEQQSIVATLDSLKSKVDRLQANYEKISQECDALKQAILRQIFE